METEPPQPGVSAPLFFRKPLVQIEELPLFGHRSIPEICGEMNGAVEDPISSEAGAQEIFISAMISKIIRPDSKLNLETL